LKNGIASRERRDPRGGTLQRNDEMNLLTEERIKRKRTAFKQAWCGPFSFDATSWSSIHFIISLRRKRDSNLFSYIAI